MFTSTGKYHYYKSWLIVECDEELARYYRSLVHSFSPWLWLQPPRHGSHITVIAGKYEAYSQIHLWKKYDGRPVIFHYYHEVQSDGMYYWLPVVCMEFEYLRAELGLTRTIPIPWHLTIGNLK